MGAFLLGFKDVFFGKKNCLRQGKTINQTLVYVIQTLVYINQSLVYVIQGLVYSFSLT